MVKYISILGALMLILNTVLGLLISGYQSFNWISGNIVILINILIFRKIIDGKISDGFKVSSLVLFPFLAIISFVLAILSPNSIKDNYYLIGFLFILFAEISLYILFKSLYSKGKIFIK